LTGASLRCECESAERFHSERRSAHLAFPSSAPVRLYRHDVGWTSQTWQHDLFPLFKQTWKSRTISTSLSVHCLCSSAICDSNECLLVVPSSSLFPPFSPTNTPSLPPCGTVVGDLCVLFLKDLCTHGSFIFQRIFQRKPSEDERPWVHKSWAPKKKNVKKKEI
jgi:hypothetical protein